MFSHKDYKPEVEKLTVDKLVEFTNKLDEHERECLITLVMMRDEVLKLEDEVPVSDEEIDYLLKEIHRGR